MQPALLPTRKMELKQPLTLEALIGGINAARQTARGPASGFDTACAAVAHIDAAR